MTDGKLTGDTKKDPDEYYFEVWKYYEDVAMHFNDLIVRIRIQSIGGLAALAAILGIFLHTQDGTQTFKCGLAIVAVVCLMLLWIASGYWICATIIGCLKVLSMRCCNLKKTRQIFLPTRKLD